MLKPEKDYRRLRPSNLCTEYKYLLLLLFWPIYGLFFRYVETSYKVEEYFIVYTPIDDFIPFFEWFVIPYLFWFAYIILMHFYTVIFDISAFRRMLWFFIITYSTTIIIYFLFPTAQELRPTEFARDNILVRFMQGFYEFDTNTNVCPSIHVIGSLAITFTGLHAKGFERWGWKVFYIACGILISVSTVFLKQHSVVDILAALPLCAIAYFVCFRTNWLVKN